MKNDQSQKIVGWREWAALPDLDIPWIKVKVDTGARSSSLHAFDIEPFEEGGVRYVRFKVQPKQRSTGKIVEAVAPLIDVRGIRSSSGQQEKRYVISTIIRMMDESWPIELTLADRSKMKFRMLLGRQGLGGHLLVDANRSYFGPRRPKSGKKRKPDTRS